MGCGEQTGVRPFLHRGPLRVIPCGRNLFRALSYPDKNAQRNLAFGIGWACRPSASAGQTGASGPTRFWPGMCTGASASACPSCLRDGRGGRGTGTRQRPPLRSLNETPRPGGRSTAPTQPSMSPTAPSGCLRGRPQRPWARIRRRQPIRRRRFVPSRPTLVPY